MLCLKLTPRAEDREFPFKECHLPLEGIAQVELNSTGVCVLMKHGGRRYVKESLDMILHQLSEVSKKVGKP